MPPPDTQTILLQQLRAAARPGGTRWVSGRQVALSAQVTLNTIHQAVHRLREAGWPIQTSQRGAALGLSYALVPELPVHHPPASNHGPPVDEDDPGVFPDPAEEFPQPY